MGKKSPGLRPDDLPVWMNNLATILRRQSKYADAEKLNRKALDLIRQALGNKHREVAATLDSLALALARQDRLDQAVGVMHASFEVKHQFFVDVHPFIGQTVSSL